MIFVKILQKIQYAIQFFLIKNAVTCFNLNDPNLLVKMF
jgi:hypothetical protein